MWFPTYACESAVGQATLVRGCIGNWLLFVTAMRFWFPGEPSKAMTAIFRDGDGNTTGTVAGVPFRNDGSFTVYEFGFDTALAPQSTYDAGYDFMNLGNPVAIGTTTSSTVAFDAALATARVLVWQRGERA
jgi:hypothetical protein